MIGGHASEAGRVRGDGVLAGVRLEAGRETLQAESQSRQAEGLSAFLRRIVGWCGSGGETRSEVF
ncbi:hypothetical protein FP514_01205 [Escherichia coli]|nr:hypothetical protein FP514_01205 [Escherichia coli]